MKKKILVIGISGATGAVYGIRILQILQPMADVETHLIISKPASITISIETGFKPSDVKSLADFYHNDLDFAAKVSSGSFCIDGMIIAPCSVRLLAEIATGVGTSLLGRVADVSLKERRRLVLMLRETPLHLGHIRNMAQATEMGAIIAPPMPAFYNKPTSIDDIINHSVGRTLDLFDINPQIVNRWDGGN